MPFFLFIFFFIERDEKRYMLKIKNSIFISFYTLCYIKALSKKLCFGLIKKNGLFKSEEFFFCCLCNMSYL
jgi:hypothetical protein